MSAEHFAPDTAVQGRPNSSAAVIDLLNRDDGGACPGRFDDELVIAAKSTAHGELGSVGVNTRTRTTKAPSARLSVIASRDCRGLYSPGATLNVANYDLTPVPSEGSDPIRRITVSVGQHSESALADTHLMPRLDLCLFLFPLPSDTIDAGDSGNGDAGYFDIRGRQLFAALVPDASGRYLSLTPAEAYLRIGQTLRRIASICGCGVCFVGSVPTLRSPAQQNSELVEAVFMSLALTFRCVARGRGFNFSVDNIAGAELYTFHAVLYHDESNAVCSAADGGEADRDSTSATDIMIKTVCDTLGRMCVSKGNRCYFLSRVQRFDAGNGGAAVGGTTDNGTDNSISADDGIGGKIERLIVRFCPASRDPSGRLNADEWQRHLSADADDFPLDLSGIY